MRFKNVAVGLALIAGISGSGCHTTSGSAADDVERARDVAYATVPQPVGTASRMHFSRQESRAEEGDFVVHQHEWFNGGVSLGPGGHRHLERLAQRMGGESFIVVVEPVAPDLKLHRDIGVAATVAKKTDAHRRVVLVELLANSGVKDADSRVVVGWPGAEGLRGDEASRVFGRMNSRIRGGGGGFGGGGGGGGGFGGCGGLGGGGGGGFGGRF